jgi:dynein heavy chain
LPTDAFSTDNAIIMENSDRWPLMIDPQMQANTWVKRMEAQNDLKVIKPTMDARNLSRTLEISVQHGVPIILEDAFETFDPLLEPLLAKNLEKKGSQLYIRLGEQIIPYDKKFRFYITTKISRPHYSPEVCVNVTMLNFQTTEEGLEDQML